MTRPRLPRLPAILKILPLIGLGVLGLAALAGEYGHRKVTQRKRSDFWDDPGKWDLPEPETLTLTANDGVELSALIFHHAATAPSVIVCHGHGGNKLTLLPIARFLVSHFNVLLLDSRGHGESGGARTTVGYEERLDVHAAVDELIGRDLGPVGVFGVSMGAAVAILAAAEDQRIQAVVADSPFARLRWAVTSAARLRGYPPLVAPTMAYAACCMTALRCHYPMAAFDPIEVVDRIAPRPLLLIHGELDEMIKASDSERLYARAGEPKELWVLTGLGHCKGMDSVCAQYEARTVSFLQRSLGGPSSLALNLRASLLRTHP
jgi:uncharacterized protein